MVTLFSYITPERRLRGKEVKTSDEGRRLLFILKWNFHFLTVSYFVALAIGIIPGTFAFAFIGSGLDSVIEAQEAANPGCASAGTCEIEISALVTPQLLAAFFALGIASLIPVVLKRIRSA